MSFFEITGHPFTDAGIYALEALIRKNYKDITPEDVRAVMMPVARLYETEPWRKCFQSIFTGDSVYTTPHYISQGKKKFPDDPAKQKQYVVEKSLNDVVNWWNSLIDDFTPAGSKGTCPICGRRDGTIPVKKAHIPLIGTGKLLNFFPSMMESEFVCPVCLLAVQFMPLNLRYIKVRGQAKFLLYHSHSEKIMRIISKQNIKDIRMQMTGEATGVVNYNKGETSFNTSSSLFSLLSEIAMIPEVYDVKNPSIVVYEFSNYNQNPPPLRVIHIPNSVFNFIVRAERTNKQKWMEVVNHGWIIDDKKKKKFPDYSKWAYNVVYENLLSGKSITGMFYSDEKKKVYGSEELLDLYLTEVLSVQSIDSAKRISDALVEYSVNKEGVEKTIKKLRSVSNFGAFRRFFLDIAEDERRRGKGLSIPYEDFVKVTEDAKLWKTMQDRILYALYEALSKFNNTSGGERENN